MPVSCSLHSQVFGLGVDVGGGRGLRRSRGHEPAPRCCTGSMARRSSVGGSYSYLLALVQFGPVGIGLSLLPFRRSLGWFFFGLLLARKLAGGCDVGARRTTNPAVGRGRCRSECPGVLVEHLVVHSEQRGVVWGLAALVCEGLGFLVTYGAVLLAIAPVTRSLISSDGGPPEGAVRDGSVEGGSADSRPNQPTRPPVINE